MSDAYIRAIYETIKDDFDKSIIIDNGSFWARKKDDYRTNLHFEHDKFRVPEQYNLRIEGNTRFGQSAQITYIPETNQLDIQSTQFLHFTDEDFEKIPQKLSSIMRNA